MDEATPRVERMHKTLIEIACAIRREQLRAGIGVLEHTEESARLQSLYDKLQPVYAAELQRDRNRGPPAP